MLPLIKFFFFPPLKILTDLWPWREGAELLAGHGTRDLWMKCQLPCVWRLLRALGKWEKLFAVRLLCSAQHLCPSPNFLLLHTHFRVSSASTVPRVLSCKSRQTFESLSHFSLWLFLLCGMKYTCVICSPGADLRGAVVYRNENRVGRQEVVKSHSGSWGRLQRAASPFCLIFLASARKGVRVFPHLPHTAGVG